MKNILVTGSNGQLGSEIRVLSSSSKFNYIFTDIEELDITNTVEVQEFFDKNNIEAVINCAAYTAVDKAEEDEKTAHLINVTGIENLKNTSKKNNIPIIHISTDYVFDGKNYKPYIESDSTNPQGIYGKTKLEGEKTLLDYEKSIIIRTAWLYSSFGANFVKTIIKIANANEQITVVDDQIGSPTYAADLAQACIFITEKSLTETDVKYGIYHYSNEGACSWYDFAKAIIEIKNIKCKVLPVDSKAFPRPAPRPHYSILNKTKIKNNFEIKIPYWKDSLIVCLEKLM